MGSQAGKGAGAGVEPAHALAFSRSLQALAGKLYEHLNASNGAGNLVFSPLSVSVCLALALEGALGETRREMLAALEVPEDDAARRSAAAAAVHAVTGAGSGALLASGAFADKTMTLLPAYAKAIGQYAAAVRQVDFAGAPGASLAAINGFVADATGNLIREILSQVGPDTRLVLVNALYFKDAWVHPFPKSRTAPLPFHTAPGSSRDVPTMRVSASFKYAHLADAGAELLELPFKGGASMLLLLPGEGGTLEGALAWLAKEGPWPARLCTLADTAAPQQITLFLPKFVAEMRAALPEALKAMGMRRAFGEGADFGGMAPEPLFVSEVAHAARYEVGEEGVEAAAATAVVMSRCALVIPRDKQVHADRPFAYALRHAPSRSLLFLGALRDPSPAK
eukprot:tig00000403_g267.t1